MCCRDIATGKNGMEVMLNLLTSTTYKWIHSPEISSALKSPLMRLCARYCKHVMRNETREMKQTNVINDFF
jgi:hypothetical protein